MDHEQACELLCPAPRSHLAGGLSSGRDLPLNLIVPDHRTLVALRATRVRIFHERSQRMRASLSTSLSTPAAVTCTPAPGPVITSGLLRYRLVVNTNWL